MVRELNPIITEIMEKNAIGDYVALFYFATLVKEGLKNEDDDNIREAVLTFMFDE